MLLLPSPLLLLAGGLSRRHVDNCGSLGLLSGCFKKEPPLWERVCLGKGLGAGSPAGSIVLDVGNKLRRASSHLWFLATIAAPLV